MNKLELAVKLAEYLKEGIKAGYEAGRGIYKAVIKGRITKERAAQAVHNEEYLKAHPTPEWFKCPTCEGKGWYLRSNGESTKAGGGTVRSMCLTCDGSGKIRNVTKDQEL